MTYRRRIGAFTCRAYRVHRQPAKLNHLNSSKCYGDDWNFYQATAENNSTAGPNFKMSRPQARAGLLAALLAASLLLASVTQPNTRHNLHDLSPLLLQDGDIEENPGPTTSTQTDLAKEDTLRENRKTRGNFDQEAWMEIWEKRYTTLEHQTEKKLTKMEAKLKKQEKLNQRLFELCEYELKKQANEQSQVQKQVQKLEGKFFNFADDTDNRMRFNDDQNDKQEQLMKRNNVWIFGVPEKDRESYWDCLQSVLQLFREAAPGVPWSEKDISKVQRLGAPRSSGRNWYQPRPILVEITTFFDKLMILKYGRELLRNKGIKISSELTTRQLKTLQDLKEEGHEAYYRNNRLWFRDRQGTQTSHRAPAGRHNRGRSRQGGTRFPSQMTGYQHDSEDAHIAEARLEEREQLDQHHRPYRGEMDGSWAHPRQPPNRHPHGTLAKSWLRLADPQVPATNARYCSNKYAPPDMDQHYQARDSRHDRRRRKTDAWKELRQDFCESDTTGSQSVDYCSADEEGSVDLLYPDAGYYGLPSPPKKSIHEGRHRTSTRPTETIQMEDLEDHTMAGGEGAHPQDSQPPSTAPHRPKTQSTVLEWLQRHRTRESPVQEDPPTMETGEEEGCNTDVSPDEDAAVWKGRLRQRRPSPPRSNTTQD